MGKINERKHYNMLAVSKSQIIKAGTFERDSHMEKLYKNEQDKRLVLSHVWPTSIQMQDM